MVAVGDTLDGQTVASLTLGRFGLDGNALSFTAGFADGSEAIFVALLNQDPVCTAARASRACRR